MTLTKLLTGAPSAELKSWDAINWDKVERHVRRLQVRIAKAIEQGRWGKVKALQRLLSRSFYAKLLAAKRVSSNKGSKTPGVDGIIWNTKAKKLKAALDLKQKGYKTQPLRRIYIPKKNGKKRPLGIPSMKCRGMQALYLLGFDPVVEMIADKNSYGFRPKRSCADAIEQCFNALCQKGSAPYILEGDIAACFDKISHEWLENNICIDKSMLQKWLKSGYIDKGTFFPTKMGTPQGGIISPTALNATLSGMEKEIRKGFKKADKVYVVVYADDFIITGRSKELLENEVKPRVAKFLKERGLMLSEEKTTIAHIDEGFDFLSHNVRKYKGKLLIKPCKASIKNFLSNIRKAIKSRPTVKTEDLIEKLNPMIRGWAYYFRHVVSKDVFARVDSEIFNALWNWTVRRHPKKGKKWVAEKYFMPPLLPKWTFYAETEKGTLKLERASSIPIRRHIKIRADANPYNPVYKAYFIKRAKRKVRTSEGQMRVAGFSPESLCEA
ncbi:MAG: group II intron reverse transcriptase/maturase [bacterium]|nr:group II intron reverse transcriptase/maturase [bacterium]